MMPVPERGLSRRPAVIACLLLAGWLAVPCVAPGATSATDRQSLQALSRDAAQAQRAGRAGEAVAGLRHALELAGPSADADLRVALENQLGGALLASGQFEEAGQVLLAALAAPVVGNRPDLAAALRNNLAHLYQAQGDNPAALAEYRQAAGQARIAGMPTLLVKARLAAAELLAEDDPQAALDLLEQAWQVTQTLPPGRESAWLSIHNAGTLLALAGADVGGNTALQVEAATRLQHAARIAEAQGDGYTTALAYGRLGEVYGQLGRNEEALSLTDTALFHAQQAQVPELRYRLEWQLGRIQQALGHRPLAIEAYRRATATLQVLRAEFAAGNVSVSAALREDATPLYLSLADLLLRASDGESDRAREQALLKEARETVELLKTTELQDYFQDDCVTAVRARIQELDATIMPGTAVLYPIALPDRIELLLSLDSGLVRRSVPVDQATLVGEIHQFRQNLEKRTTRQYLRQSRQLYQWLIKPLEQELQDSHIDTLVVVPGTALRAVPIAALNDGKDFLIRRYAIAMTPSLRLTDPRPIRREHINLLLSGLTEARQGFPPLVHVNAELGAIHDLYGGKVFKDESYRKDSVEQELAEHPYSIVHFATHGQFAGKVSDSFILTWDGKMNMNDLEDFVGVSWFRKDDPVELLTLSACETAAGDDTAALGLASVAIKAGARSALASLWSINDQASSELVSDFYTRLKDPDISKAQALRLAQVGFLDDLRYKHPSYWAPFLLIGNWL